MIKAGQTVRVYLIDDKRAAFRGVVDVDYGDILPDAWIRIKPDRKTTITINPKLITHIVDEGEDESV